MSATLAATQPIETEVENLNIAFVPLDAVEDDISIAHLTQVINGIYEEAETGIFVSTHTRTNIEEVKTLIRSRQLVVATVGAESRLSSENFRGCIRVAMLSAEIGTFGTLCAVSSGRRAGVGRRLVSFAEDDCRKHGAIDMQLELVVPTTYELPLKVWIQAWYEKMGYVAVADEDFRTHLPHLAANLNTPVVFRIFRKRLPNGL